MIDDAPLAAEPATLIMSMDPDADVDALAGPGSNLNEIPVSFITMTLRSNLNSFSVEDDLDPEPKVNLFRIRGFRPLSSTFFRALMPTQSTSCFMASRSDTACRGAVRRIVLARGRVP